MSAREFTLPKLLIYCAGVVAFAVAIQAMTAGESDEDAIESAVTGWETSADPEVCETLATDRFLSQRFPLPPGRALTTCRARIGDERSRAESVEVTGVRVFSRGAASAHALLAGGPVDGSRLEYSLLRIDGEWRLDGLDVIAVDRGGLTVGYREGLLAAPFRFPAAAASCAVMRFRTRSDLELAASILYPADPVLFLDAIACDRRGVVSGLIANLRAGPYRLSARRSGCVRRRSATLSARELAEAFREPRISGPLLARCDRGAVLTGYRSALADDGYSRAQVRCAVARLRRMSAGRLTATFANESRAQVIAAGCG